MDFIQLSVQNEELRSQIPAIESVISVIGTLRNRPEKDINESQKFGQFELVPDEVTVLNKVEVELPFKTFEQTKHNEPLRSKFRYLDLRNPTSQDPLRFKSELLLNFRNFLCSKHDFVEIETPLLFRATPGGAREFVVPTSNESLFYTLPQSPQQFKQLLVIGGIGKYMQIAKCFRDEQLKPDRQPEFTQLDLEMPFITKEDVYELIENLLLDSWPLVSRNNPSNLEIPFRRMDFVTAMKLYGSDKPDTRFEWLLQDSEDFTFFSIPSAILDKTSKTQIKNFVKNFNSQSRIRILCDKMTKIASVGSDHKPDDMAFYVAGKELKTVYGICTVHHPFTAPTEDTVEFLRTDPLRVTGLHYDLVCNGHEIGGGSIRIHDGKTQKFVLDEILKMDSSQMSHLLEALSSGAPPHGGIALGIERLMALLYGTTNIRDMIAFPKNSFGRDNLFGAPCTISTDTLNYYNLQIKHKS
ncbi:hypothetical protein Ciccas_006616 [Cichlidogyrus casuarinus]|uniref:Aminoacyl-transfer RNA synthetases class-II family profile domain-containing protein n=1 Tax=Cichlidogyrus casuarinus TaxID=1844966 RepID=A0ABD2Q584_9PLAT